MILTRTPQDITKPIRELCRTINADNTPVFLPIVPESGCQPGDCFHNVRRKTETAGGHIQFGWAIWEWPNVYIEAEHHAVHVSADGRAFSDITPSGLEGFTHRLFLPDDTATYDFDNEGVRKDNHRVALTNDILVQQFFRTAREHVRIMNSLPGIGEVAVDRRTALQLATLEQENARLCFEIAMKHTSRNARCFCGSGKKFKHCHGGTAL